MSIRAEEITEILKSQIKGTRSGSTSPKPVSFSPSRRDRRVTASKRRCGRAPRFPSDVRGMCSTSRRTTSAWSSSATTA